jgi:hypothetical protein
MKIRTRPAVVLLTAATLALPAAAVAAPGQNKSAGADGGNRVSAKVKAKERKERIKPGNYILRGTYDAEAGSMDVSSGNRAARRAELLKSDVVLDLSRAKLSVADRDGDGRATSADLATGDRVVVQLKLTRSALASGPLTVRRLVDRTAPPSAEEVAPATGEGPSA